MCVRAQNNMWPLDIYQANRVVGQAFTELLDHFAWTFDDHYRIVLHMLSLASGHMVQSSVVFVMTRAGVPAKGNPP